MSVGLGILQGLLVTLRHFAESSRQVLASPRGEPVRQLPNETGVFTVQYPEERLEVPERLRYFPVLILDEQGVPRCTSCGICAKVCPPQCIWIERTVDEQGKPVPQPKEFVIDTSICMQCGFCAEYCPFDAIKMDHRYELGSYNRIESLILEKERLFVPLEYYAQTHPTDFAAEEEERRRKEEADRQKAEARARAAAAKAAGGAATASDRPAKPRPPAGQARRPATESESAESNPPE